METPRTTRSAQPEMQFTGGTFAPGPHTVSDPAISAAFIAFHRKNSGASLGVAPKRRINRAGIALAALALLGFGGGLSLAFFSFNSPEASGSAFAARAPEIIYRAPAAAIEPPQQDSAPLLQLNGETALFAASAFELRAEDEPIPETSIFRGPDVLMSGAFAGLQGATSAGSLAAAAPGGFPAASAVGAAADVTIGFDALTAAPVPEPSTWASMVTGAALLLAFAKLKRRQS